MGSTVTKPEHPKPDTHRSTRPTRSARAATKTGSPRKINRDIHDVVREMKTSGVVVFPTHPCLEPATSTGGNGGNGANARDLASRFPPLPPVPIRASRVRTHPPFHPTDALGARRYEERVQHDASRPSARRRMVRKSLGECTFRPFFLLTFMPSWVDSPFRNNLRRIGITTESTWRWWKAASFWIRAWRDQEF